MTGQEVRDEGQIYVRRGGVYLLDEHAGVMIDSAGNFVAKTRAEPRAMAAMLRLIAADIEEGTPRLAREWEGGWPARAVPIGETTLSASQLVSQLLGTDDWVIVHRGHELVTDEDLDALEAAPRLPVGEGEQA